MEKLILVTNDDGYAAPGLKALAEAVKGLGKIVICAPSTKRKSNGRSHTVRKPISNRKCTISGEEAHVLNCSPASCVAIAIEKILERRPDIVLSGINDGENVGVITPISGTASAAAEAAEYGIPAVAISQDRTHDEVIDFGPAKHFARMFTEKALSGGLDFRDYGFVNVNLPLDAKEDTDILYVEPNDEYSHSRDFRKGGKTFWYDFGTIRDKQYRKGTDAWVIFSQKKVAVTFLKPGYGFKA